MKKMNFLRVIGMMILVGLVFTGCKKDQPGTQPATQGIDVQFGIEFTDFSNLKGSDEVPVCQDIPLSYVVFTVMDANGVETTFTSDVLYVDTQMLTQAIKLDPGTYYVTSFYVYSSVLNGEDILVRAAPLPNSEYHKLMANALNKEFTVSAFEKAFTVVDVLCYEDFADDKFGFEWLELNDVRIERLCFFGDVCTGKVAEWKAITDNNLYATQTNGVAMDMPAIFKVIVKGGLDGDKVFSNESYLGVGDCLEVTWANDLDKDDVYTVELWVLLPVGNKYEYVLIDTYDMTDDFPADFTGDDNVFDFTIGNCNIEGSDMAYQGWMHLPTMMNATIEYPGADSYWDITVNSFSPAGTYPFTINTLYPGWCGDEVTEIPEGTYDFYAYSSLFPASWPADHGNMTAEMINQINWLFNNLDLYPTATTGELQVAIWAILAGDLTNGIANDASAYSNYAPVPGEYAAVLLFTNPDGDTYFQQLLFIQVDP